MPQAAREGWFPGGLCLPQIPHPCQTGAGRSCTPPAPVGAAGAAAGGLCAQGRGAATGPEATRLPPLRFPATHQPGTAWDWLIIKAKSFAGRETQAGLEFPPRSGCSKGQSTVPCRSSSPSCQTEEQLRAVLVPAQRGPDPARPRSRTALCKHGCSQMGCWGAQPGAPRLLFPPAPSPDPPLNANFAPNEPAREPGLDALSITAALSIVAHGAKAVCGAQAAPTP